VENDNVRKALKEHALGRDTLELGCGDALDIKAGLVLVVLTFLAGQAVDLFKDVHGLFSTGMEALSVGAVGIGALAALVQWFPRKYRILSHPTSYKNWLEKLVTAHSGTGIEERETLKYIENIEIAQAIERVDENRRLNERKLFLMKICFICVFVALLANVAMLASRHLFPLCR
jgi:hypothetical protein